MTMTRRQGPALALLATLALAATPALAGGGTVKGKVKGKKKYLKDVVVYLEGVKGDFKPPAKAPVMDQRNLTFVPHVLPVLVGTSVEFLNSDSVRHNVFSPEGKYNLGTWPTGEKRSHTFKETGVFTQLCNVHPEMEGYVVVRDNPFFAVAGRNGSFELSGVPPGSYTLTGWHKKKKVSSVKVTVEAGKTVEAELKL